MIIFRYNDRWVASEKLAEERQDLLFSLLESLEPLLQQHQCAKVDLQTWSHEPSDTLIHLCCLPRTHG